MFLIINTACHYPDNPQLFFFLFVFCFLWWLLMGPLFVPCSWMSIVLQKSPPGPINSSVFQHLLHIWTLSVTIWFCDQSFDTEDNWGTQTQNSNIHWCSRRKHDILRHGGENFWNGMQIKFFSLFCLNINGFHCITALQKQHNILHVSLKSSKVGQYDPSYFVRIIIIILQILQGLCKPLSRSDDVTMSTDFTFFVCVQLVWKPWMSVSDFIFIVKRFAQELTVNCKH